MKTKFEIDVGPIDNAKDAVKAIARLLQPVDIDQAEELCDKFGVCGYMGEAGDGGRTYYPKGTNVEDNYLEYALEYNDVGVDENGLTTEGVWISSSEMC